MLMSSLPPDHHHDGAVYRSFGAAREFTAGFESAAGEDDRLWAMMAYLGVIFFAFVAPLAVYLVKLRESPFVRWHAAQALNLWITVFLYSVSFVIVGAVLALDTVSTALAVGVPLVAAAGLTMLGYAVLAALAASRGAMYRIPRWICTPLVR